MMDKRRFESEFRKLYLPLGMYALRYVGDTDSAEDTVQNAFLKAWQAIGNGSDITDFKAFMYRCVRNECISFLRRQEQFVGIEDVPEVEDTDIDTSERDARIWRAIDDLPDRCREVFLLSKRDGLSNEEIAAELDISVKTVKNQMTKAFSRLRAALSTGHKPFYLPFL
ncbi:MAG: RNA polymerase sigma-70 factor [Muribaculaceae bacterium]|nr:RNA polymerase sigma-70 factor [Muribaculaceae bacterium]MDE6564682.1 RNA polymerase sigma-70 factor [Muribaculaceae bacterium]